MELPIRRWMTVHDAACYLGVSNSKIYKMIAQHSIPYRKVGASIRLGSYELDEWMRKEMVKPIKRELQLVTDKVLDNV